MGVVICLFMAAILARRIYELFHPMTSKADAQAEQEEIDRAHKRYMEQCAQDDIEYAELQERRRENGVLA
jgi:hypothetical protein